MRFPTILSFFSNIISSFLLAIHLVLQLTLDEDGKLVELGVGGQAIVYLGRLPGMEVAVKVGGRVGVSWGVVRARDVPVTFARCGVVLSPAMLRAGQRPQQIAQPLSRLSAYLPAPPPPRLLAGN